MFVQQVVPADNGGPPPASGRASYRGGAREPKPGMAGGEGMRAPADEMARLSLGGADGGRGDRRRRYGDEPHTRPAHVTDKSGKTFILNSHLMSICYENFVKGNSLLSYTLFSKKINSLRTRISYPFTLHFA